jgi:hypothetical protein
MNLKKLGLALVVVCALGALVASSAFAAATQKNATWRTGSTGTVLTGSETVKASGSGELVTTVGETPLVLKSAGLECLECKVENSSGNAIGSGKLKFTGVTVSTPATCAVSGGSVTTLALKINAGYMGAGTTNYVLFQPNSGTTFATVTLTAGSGSCPLSGSYIVSGKDFVQSNNATGVYEVNQTVQSSGTINSEASGEATPLKFGSKEAKLNGSGTFAFSGGKAGTVFGTHE